MASAWRRIQSLSLVGALVACSADRATQDAPSPDVRDAPVGIDAPVDATSDGVTDAPSSDGGPDVPGADPASAIAAAVAIHCGAWARAMCTDRWDCGCYLDVIGDRPANLEACVEFEEVGCVELRGYETEFSLAFRRDGARVDEGALARCRALTADAYGACHPAPPFPGDWPIDCTSAIVTFAPVGEPCAAPFLCAGGEGACSAGRCVDLPARGEPCSVRCADGLACVELHCTDPRGEGEACGDHEDCTAPALCTEGRCRASRQPLGGRCVEAGDCATGLVCEAGTCAAGPSGCGAVGEACGAARVCEERPARRCRAPTGLGDRCYEDQGCAPGLVCDVGADVPGACVPPPTEGQPCYGRCAAGLVCMGSRTDGDPLARCAPPRRLGERCDDVGAGGEPVCDAGLSCLGGICVDAPRLGEACSSGTFGDDFLCADGLGCRWEGAFRCLPPGEAGASCVGNLLFAECVEGLYCHVGAAGVGSCTPIPVEGERCDGACAEGQECIADASGVGTCRRLPVDGATCERACAGGAVCAPETRFECVADVCRSLRVPTLWDERD